MKYTYAVAHVKLREVMHLSSTEVRSAIGISRAKPTPTGKHTGYRQYDKNIRHITVLHVKTNFSSRF